MKLALLMFLVIAAIQSALAHTVELTWVDTDPNVVSYNMYRATLKGGPYTKIATGITTQDYIDATVVNGTTYWYAVTAVYKNPYKETVKSNKAQAIVPQ